MILSIYRWLSPLLAALLPLAAPFSPKLAATLRWRRECRPGDEELRDLAGREPRFWIHAASAGELEQALPLLAGLRRRHPQGALLLTLASASARRAAGRVAEADLVIPLPADTPRAMGGLLNAFGPTALLLVKWDVWPNLIGEARRRQVPVLLLGAVLSSRSRRARWPGRLLSAPLHRRLAGIGAASEEDARQFLALGAEPARLRVTGDTRFDRVVARRDEKRPRPLSDASGRPERCLVAGSTWPPEEDMLLAAFARLRSDWPNLRLLLVPHEPGEAALLRLEREAASAAIPLWRLSARAELAAGSVCVVDRVGVLPELYPLGDLALVGGGFGQGVHSVLEPACHGLPVLTGPRIGRADEARRLMAAGGGFVIRDGEELYALWRSFLAHPETLAEAARRARDFVESGDGALERSLAFMSDVLAGDSSGKGA